MNFGKNNSLRFNLTFWLAYFTYEWLVTASVDDEYRRYFINAMVLVPITFLASVFTVHVLFNKFYLTDKRTFWIGLIVSIVAFALIRRTFNWYYTYPLYYTKGLAAGFFFLPKLIIEAVNIYVIVGLYSMFYFIRAWYEEQRQAQEFRQEKIEAELQMLKSQIHPHFIFNTLNNIYSYALHKNAKTPDLIHRLSSFLSYNLYDSKLNSIPLTRELEYIRSYIELEQIRYGDHLDVSFNVFSDTNEFRVSPLLLLPLVENCFKHGFTSSAIDKSWIRIDISRQSEWLTVKIENSVGSLDKPFHDRNGIGLENVVRRLEIIYPNAHEFKYISEQNSFFTVLKIRNLIAA